MNLEELGIPYTDLGDKKEIELFWHISQSLVSKRYLQEILQLIVTMTAEVMRTKICSLMLLDEATQELRIVATQALSADYVNKGNVKVGESISGRAVLKRGPITILNVAKEKDYGFPDIARQEKLASMISVPMQFEERVIGVINAYTREPHKFTELEVKILQAVANQAAVAIEHTRLREENVAVKQALEERKVVERAKMLLMEKEKLSEADAYQLLQKTSRDSRRPMVEVAQSVILVYGMKKG